MHVSCLVLMSTRGSQRIAPNRRVANYFSQDVQLGNFKPGAGVTPSAVNMSEMLKVESPWENSSKLHRKLNRINPRRTFHF